MQNCSFCDIIGTWKCACSDTLFCIEHITEHSNTHVLDSNFPNVSQILFPISDKDSSHFKQEIHHRLNTINSYKEKILTQTEILISKIKNLSKNIISQLENEKKIYKNLLIKSYFEKEEHEKVKQILKTTLKIKSVQNNFDISENIENSYKIKSFKNSQNFKGSYAVSKLANLYDIYIQSHTRFVLSVAISHDNKYIASGSDDKYIRIWDLQQKKQEFYFEGHKSSVQALSFTPDGKKLISGSKDSMIIVWDLQERCKKCEFKGYIGEIWGLAVTVNSDIVLSASNDGLVIAWNIDDLSEISKLSGHEDAVLCIGISNNGEFCISGSSDKSLIIWDLATYKQKNKLLGHRNAVCAIALFKDNKNAVSGSVDKTIRIWDLESLSQIIIIQAHKNIVRSVAVSSDGSFVVSASYDKIIKIWDIKNVSLYKEMIGHIGEINSIVITEDNEILVSVADDLSIRVWDIKNGKENFKMPGHTDLVIGAGTLKYDDDTICTISNDETICYWDRQTKCQSRQCLGRSYRIDSISIGNKTKSIFSISSGFMMIPYLDFKASSKNFILKDYNVLKKKCIALSHSESFLIEGSEDTNLYIFDIDSKNKCSEMKAKFSGHTGKVSALAISENDEKVISGGFDNLIIIWDIKSLTIISILQAHTGPISSISIYNNKIISTSYDKSVRLWDLNNKKCESIFHGHTSWVLCSSISNDGEIFATGGGDKDCGIIIWNLNDKIMKNVLVGHQGAITGVAIIKNGIQIISTSIDKTLRLWNAKTGIQELIIYTYSEGFSALCVSADEKYAVVGSEDMTVHIIDLDCKRKLCDKSYLSLKKEINKAIETYTKNL
ncbi:hypothetical protein SteCoe_1719 [Stentor coeruleus]|uniref:Uncharacterized protein n=1 Tax=Stentor coeruleus TaxID=5963 RepID=A0A1R2D1D9_9CILI|nr:hypothetical protein SteCoe_1719 [Stentor coeruleus]